MQEDWMAELEQVIGYAFADRRLLRQAMTHSSCANELKINKCEDYERLEFLGDAVLELTSSDYIFRANPDMPEGKMTKLRSSIVCEPALAYCARELGLDRFIMLGRGEEATGGRARDSIVSDVMEAVIGAVYLDGGQEKAGEFIRKYILSDLEHKKLFYDAKTILQEEVQKTGRGTLSYELIREEGPEHDKTFCVEALIDGVRMGGGSGHSKKAAEQKAAYEALLKLRGGDMPAED